MTAHASTFAVRRPLRITGAAVAIGVAAGAVWWMNAPGHHLRRRSGLEILARFADGVPHRTIEGRLSGFAGKPYRAGISMPAAFAAAALDALNATPGGPESLHVKGVTSLLRGDVDGAIRILDQAAATDGGGPAILNDLAVAHLERAARIGTATDIVDAFELSDRALRADPESPAAAFNRAMAIERLGLRGEAVTAWRSCLRRGSDGGWASEAAEHVGKLAIPTHGEEWDQVVARFDESAARSEAAAVDVLVRRYPAQARKHFEEELCGQWAAAEQNGDHAAAERLLRTLTTIASSLAAITGNDLPRRAVAAIDESRGEPARRASLIEGHLAYQQAMGFYRAVEITRGEPLLRKSEDLLRRGRSPFALLPLFYRASSRSYENDIDGALRLLDQTERELTAAGLTAPPAYGHVLWVRGRSLLKRGYPHASLSCFQRALALFERTGEMESIAALRDLLALNDAFLGEDDDAWRHYAPAVDLAERAGARQRERAILHSVTGFALSRGRARVALLYTSTHIRLAIEDHDAGDQARAHLDRSRALHALGDARAADADIRRARVLADQVRDRGMRDELNADLSAAEATVVSDGGSDGLARFDRAIAVATSVEKTTLLPRLWTERALAARAAHRDDEAERSLREGIAVIEKRRWSVADPDLQIAFAEQWYRVFDELIDLLVAHGRTGEALAFAERSRARTLLAEIGSGGRAFAEVPSGYAVLEYASLERITVLWVVRSDGVSCLRLPIDQGALERMVASCRPSTGAGGQALLQRNLTALYDTLVRPAERHLQPGDRLIFVPDKSLQDVPFAALFDRAGNRWLVEERAIGVAPSLQFFLAANARDAELAREGRDRILAVGDPAFDAQRFPALPRLPASGREAREISSLYGEATTLTGPEATPARLRSEARGCPVVHLATHALANSRLPSWSALLLSPEGAASTGIVYGFEIDRRTFGSTRLVVLAGCDTGEGKRTRYEGTLGLARSFLSAGVPTVVATSWPIDDATSRELLLRFHQRLRAGDDALAALQAAQLALIHGSSDDLRRVSAWAAFEVIGGVFQKCPSDRTKGERTC